MLSCLCSYDDGAWYYYSPQNFSAFHQKRRKRCCSCNQLIAIGSQSVRFARYRSAKSDIEERIYGDEVPLAPFFMCEACGEIFFNLSVIGYCIFLGDNMQNLLSEYWDMTGFKPYNQSLTPLRRETSLNDLTKTSAGA